LRNEVVDLEQAIKVGDSVQVGKMLESKKALVNQSFSGDRTPLHVAVQEDKMVVAQILIEHGAQIETKDNEGRTPLHLAALGGNLDMVKFLKKNGASHEARDNSGKYPIDLTKNKKVKDYLQSLVRWN